MRFLVSEESLYGFNNFVRPGDVKTALFPAAVLEPVEREALLVWPTRGSQTPPSTSTTQSKVVAQ